MVTGNCAAAAVFGAAPAPRAQGFIGEQVGGPLRAGGQPGLLVANFVLVKWFDEVGVIKWV